MKGLLLKPSLSRSQTKVPMKRTHEGLSTSDVWKSHWPWSRYNEDKRQLHIWPWNLEPSRSRSQTKVPMERTHQDLSTFDVWKRHWPWSRYNEDKRQLHIWPWNLEHSRSRSQTKVPMERNSSRYIYIWCVKEFFTMVLVQWLYTPITHLTLKLRTFKVKVTDKGPDGNNSWSLCRQRDRQTDEQNHFIDRKELHPVPYLPKRAQHFWYTCRLRCALWRNSQNKINPIWRCLSYR